MITLIILIFPSDCGMMKKNMYYTGSIIEESLENTDVLKKCAVLSTKVSIVSEKSKTPWLQQWTIHKVSVPENKAQHVAEQLSHVIDREHQSAWYADFRNDHFHYIIYREKVFFVAVDDREKLDDAKEYGKALGIPEYQLTF